MFMRIIVHLKASRARTKGNASQESSYQACTGWSNSPGCIRQCSRMGYCMPGTCFNRWWCRAASCISSISTASSNTVIHTSMKKRELSNSVQLMHHMETCTSKVAEYLNMNRNNIWWRKNASIWNWKWKKGSSICCSIGWNLKVKSLVFY